jgi:hypothetical protein
MKKNKAKELVYELVPYDPSASSNEPLRKQKREALEIYGGLLKVAVRAEGWAAEDIGTNHPLEGVPISVFNANIQKQISSIEAEHPGATGFSLDLATTWDSANLHLVYLRPLTYIEKARYLSWKRQKQIEHQTANEKREAKERALLAELTKKYGTVETGRVSSKKVSVSNTPKGKKATS